MGILGMVRRSAGSAARRTRDDYFGIREGVIVPGCGKIDCGVESCCSLYWMQIVF